MQRTKVVAVAARPAKLASTPPTHRATACLRHATTHDAPGDCPLSAVCVLVVVSGCVFCIAGPLFDSSDAMSFYNLELSDTNVVDHNTHDYGANNDKTFTVLEC